MRPSVCTLAVLAALYAARVEAADSGSGHWAVQYGPFSTVEEGHSFASKVTNGSQLYAVIYRLHNTNWKSQVLVQGYQSPEEAQIACHTSGIACSVRKNVFPMKTKISVWNSYS